MKALTALQNGTVHELGVVICKACGHVIGTLPTTGSKKIYGVCSGGGCTENGRT